MQLEGRLTRREMLSCQERDQMFQLMSVYYANMQRSVFDADLEEKQWVILVSDPCTRAIRGFSTQTLVKSESGAEPVRALFSGDTIVDQQYWARNPLAKIWGRFALSLIGSDESDLYWFLISKGYKTYRFLPLFFREYYPRFDAPTPGWAQDAIDALATSKFGDAYDASRSIVTADRSACHLRTQIADVNRQRLRDPHVRHFVARNPGHAHGDELCCLAPLTRGNFTDAAYRVIGTDQLSATAR